MWHSENKTATEPFAGHMVFTCWTFSFELVLK